MGAAELVEVENHLESPVGNFVRFSVFEWTQHVNPSVHAASDHGPEASDPFILTGRRRHIRDSEHAHSEFE